MMSDIFVFLSVLFLQSAIAYLSYECGKMKGVKMGDEACQKAFKKTMKELDRRGLLEKDDKKWNNLDL